MSSRHFTSIGAVLTILLMSFHCGHNRWTKYASDYKIQVNPETIQVRDDTLRFDISIDARAKKLRPDETQIFEVYVKGPDISHKVIEITLPREKLIQQEVVHALEQKKSIHSLELRFIQYRSGKLKLVSPDLQIAAIDDVR